MPLEIHIVNSSREAVSLKIECRFEDEIEEKRGKKHKGELGFIQKGKKYFRVKFKTIVDMCSIDGGQVKCFQMSDEQYAKSQGNLSIHLGSNRQDFQITKTTGKLEIIKRMHTTHDSFYMVEPFPYFEIREIKV